MVAMADASDKSAETETTVVPSDYTTRFVTESGLAGRIARLVEPAIEGLGYRLVRVMVTGSDAQTLQIMAERPDGSMAIEDCETISRQLSPMLDTSDPISGAYRLEISSPGIDRPLVRPSDFETWAGYEARIELREPIEGRKRFRGMIEGFEDGEARIAVDLEKLGRQVIGLSVSGIAEAKLILTDELIRESLRRSKAAGAGYGDGVEIDNDELDIPPDQDGDGESGDDAPATTAKPRRRVARRNGKA